METGRLHSLGQLRKPSYPWSGKTLRERLYILVYNLCLIKFSVEIVVQLNVSVLVQYFG